MAGPMTELLKKDKVWEWGTRQLQAFENLKRAMRSAPVLKLADASRPYVMATDASDYAVGAVLMQDFGNGLQPVAYTSRKLHGPEMNYPVHDKEMLAVVHAFQQWRCYLESRPVTVQTDHYALKFLKTQPNLSRRQTRWMEFLESHFDYTVEYKPGKLNPADPLSRLQLHQPEVNGVIMTSRLSPIIEELFLAGYEADESFRTWKPSDATRDESLWRRRVTNQILVPQYDLLRKILLTEAHDSAYSGHFGADKTLKALARRYWWPQMQRDVENHCKACEVCQRNKARRQKPFGELQPLPVPSQPWTDWSMDYIFGLPITKRGHTGILVVCDRFSKASHFIPCNENITAAGTVQLLMENCIKHHGLPRSIISDRDPRFMSKFWRAVFQKFGTKLQPSTAFHPQTDGQTERTNQTLEQLLRCTLEGTADWDLQLPILELAYNTSVSTSTGSTPYKIVYGREAVTPLDLTPTKDIPAVADYLQKFSDLWGATHDNILRAQASQRKSANKRRAPGEFSEGDKVMLSTENIKLAGEESNKLKPRWIGPFVVISKKNPTVYKLQLPPTL